MWYNLPPAEYAKGLRYSAERSDECAKHRRSEGRAWSEGEALRFERQARRLRAMAILCDRSSASRAGDVDMMGMHRPEQSHEELDKVLATIEALERTDG